jgi:two-component system sensor histidine kinase/response regulator
MSTADPMKSETTPLTRISIRQKVQAIIMLTCAAALAVAFIVLTLDDRRTALRYRIQDVTTGADLVGTNSAAALTFGDAAGAVEVLRTLRSRPDVLSACLYTASGKPLAKYSRDNRDDFAFPPPQLSSFQISGKTLKVFRQIYLKGEGIGTIFVEADLADLQSRDLRFLGVVLLVSLASLCVAYLLASRLQRVVSGPILDLAHTASTVTAEGQYSIRAVKRSDDEIGVLFDQFNGMLDRIQQRDAALQRAHNELEARVAERTSYLNALIENSPLAIMVCDSEQTIQLCNPAFEKLFQYSREEVIGKPMRAIFGNEILMEAREVPLLRVNEAPVNISVRRTRKDGVVVDVELHTVALIVKHEVKGSLAIYQDISVRKRAEEAMQRAKEAAEATSRAKSEFLANMSHEIRTPMNGIIGMTELVLDTQLDPEQRDYLNLAKISADFLLTLINDILDYSKIEAGKLEIDSIEFNLASTIGDTMKTLSLRAHQKGLELAFEIGPEVPHGLIGDPGRLRQIIVNLVGNAIKFTENGEVILFVKVESMQSSQVRLHFTVADTGIGIPKDKQKAIFDAFQQVDGSMTRKYGGTGLGLTISSRLVELMGGKIWVESELGKGSKFHFTVSLDMQKGPARTIVPKDPVTLHEMRALIVDDNSTNRHILVKMLENWHMKPTAVDSGARAIVTLREAVGLGRAFPLILLDAQMPEMDGFALAEAIKQNPEWRTVTVMMLSSAGQRGDAIRCRELGIAAYLTKPVRQDELLDAILVALSSRPKRAPLVTRHSLREERRQFRILLAEDNPVNQVVAVRLLEKNGHTVTVAENGRIALDIWQRQPFDLILMDVQMPEMDGLQATQAIRDHERRNRGHIPVVAMTAHAMKGDQERCLAAGMDAYLTKPIHTQELLATLERCVAANSNVEVIPTQLSSKPDFVAMDFAAALDRLEGDRQLLEEIAHLFAEESPKSLSAIHAAINARDAQLVERLAHSVKGAAANLSANRVAQAALALEDLARIGDLADAPRLLLGLEEEIARLLPEVESLFTKVAQ